VTHLHKQKCKIALITGLIICLGTSLSSGNFRGQTTTYAQTATSTISRPLIEWNATFGLGYYNTAYQIIQTQDNGYAVTGMYGPFGSRLNSALVKYDADGNLLWNQSYGIRFFNYPTNTGLLQTTDGGYVLVGNRDIDVTLTLIKTDSEGKSQWNQTYPNVNCLAWGVTQTRDGQYLILGGRGDGRGVLIKTDVSGEMKWSKTYEANYFRSVVQADDGNYVAAGGDRIVKVDTSGNIIWDKILPSALPSDPEQYRYSGNDISTLIRTVDGGYALMGRTLNENKNGSGSVFTLIIKTDASGTIQWNSTYGESGRIWPYSVIQTSDNGYALAGTASNDMILIKTDETGNEQWTQTFGDSENDETAFSLIQTSDGGFALAGKVKEGTAFSSGNFYIVKTTADNPSTEIGANTILPTVAAVAIVVTICILLIALIRKYRRDSAAS
jgi:hypothetical protein